MEKKYSLSFFILLFLLSTPSVFAQYCIPDFKTWGCSMGDLIDDFIIKDSAGNIVFSHLGTGCSPNAYGDFTSDSNLLVELDTNTNYEFEVTTQSSSQLVQIWIDFNNNESFEDEGELIFESSGGNNYGDPVVGAFNISDFEGIANTRMRVKLFFNQGTSDSCSQSNNFGGEAHDYTVVVTGEVQNCFSPIDLTVSQTGSSEMTFGWENIPEATNGYSWYLMNYGEHPDYVSPIDSDTLAAGTDSLVLTSIQENKNYEFYIRSSCDNATESIWRNIPFYIAGEGANCDKPLAIGSLPYSHSDTTLNYLNLFENITGCGDYEGYLSGYEVVYHYKADDDQILNISLDNLSATHSAVLVYEDCNDIGVNCPAEGSVVKNSSDSHDFEIKVEENKDYYFVVSSSDPTNSFDYTLNIDGYDCANVPMPIGETGPYFLPGSVLSSLEISGSIFNEEFNWYSDSLLSQKITDPTTELLVEGNTYYVTQKVLGCQGQALAITPLEFTCDVLNPNVVTDKVELCIPGGEVILKALTSVAGEQLYWYESETAEAPIAEGEELEVGHISVSTSYWVTEGRYDEEGELLCESDKIEVIIDVSDDFPEAPKVEPIYTFCGENTFTLRDIPVEGEKIRWFDSYGEALDLDTELEDGVTYHVVDKSYVCISQIADVTVYLKDYSQTPLAETEQTFEEGEVLLSLEVEGENLRWYSDEEMKELLPVTTSLEDGKTYYVTQTEENLCESLPLGITVTKILGYESFVYDQLEYTNPVENILYLKNKEKIQSIEIFDISGKKQKVSIHSLLDNNMEIDFSPLSSGVYLMKIVSTGVQKTVQIIKK